MSINYHLVNEAKQTVYDLGTSSWFFLRDEIEAVTDLEYLEELLHGDIYRGYEEGSQRPRIWSAWKAQEIYNLCQGTKLESLKVVSHDSWLREYNSYERIDSEVDERIAEAVFCALFRKEEQT